jgi:hypothetical protein
MASDPIGAIREGLAANLAVIKGWQVSAYVLMSPTYPCIQVFPAPATYDLAMVRGLDSLPFTIQALAGAFTDQAAQMNLDQLLAPYGAMSVKQAVESDRTLGGAAEALQVTDSTGYMQLVSGGSPTLMASWTVQILAKGA